MEYDFGFPEKSTDAIAWSDGIGNFKAI